MHVVAHVAMQEFYVMFTYRCGLCDHIPTRVGQMYGWPKWTKSAKGSTYEKFHVRKHTRIKSFVYKTIRVSKVSCIKWYAYQKFRV